MNHRDKLTIAHNDAIKVHQTRFAFPPTWVGAAPGRVNLIGEHIDYNQGFVLPFAIDRYTTVAASPANQTGSDNLRTTSSSTVYTDVLDQTGAIIDNRQIKPGEPAWLNYVKGVWQGFQQLGFEIPCLNVSIHSTVPVGGGLSSSAALEVATATMLEAVLGETLDQDVKIKLCRMAEHDFANVPCGIMDQFIAVCGKPDHLLLLDCRDERICQIPFDSSDASVILINSGVKHELASSQYSVRRQQCAQACQILGVKSLRDVSMNTLQNWEPKLDETVYRRARHVVSEIKRTQQCADALRQRDWQLAGRLMFDSHESLQSDYEVSCHELDTIVDIARQIGLENGLYGARMTGGGFGGFVVLLANHAKASDVMKTIKQRYHQSTGTDPCAFQTRPSQGASALF